MIRTLEDPFYYLGNFHRVLDWISERYSDLLTLAEQEFIASFRALPQAPQALLVRMVMRKGELFRASKLIYQEIGSTAEAAAPLAALGWIDDQPLLTLDQLFGLLRKPELAQAFRLSPQQAGARKPDQLAALRSQSEVFTEPRRLADWYPGTDDRIYQVLITPLCDRLRLMFFGNLYQDWSEFVLSDLGIFKYEKVEFLASSRGFRTRRDVDAYLHIHQCRERFHAGEAPDTILPDLAAVSENDWIESRRGKLLFQLAQYHEQLNELQNALDLYAGCVYPGSRIRAIRVLERSDQLDAACQLAQVAEDKPESEAEKQQLARIMPRLRRKLGQVKLPAPKMAAVTLPRLDLSLSKPNADFSVEYVVRDHLTQASEGAVLASVYYVENTLMNSLFGLLCWNAVFSAVPGAFFHPFHTGPTDLHSADFRQRREPEFSDRLSQLDSELYKKTIVHNFKEKIGTQSPFVFWEFLSEDLLHLALECIPATHLKKCFERILLDIKSNRSGLPDLIQFWPEEKRYRMIEVKGPGDRLQDNQIRWLDYCVAHDMPVTVCYVQWAESAN